MQLFEYEVAISFAGEQRDAAEAIAKLLKAARVSVFYDKDEKANLWGKDLYVHLSEIYQHKAQYCILLASQEYAKKVWTNHERRSAQARAVSEKDKDYLLPVRMDDTEIPGLAPTIGYLDYRREGAQGVANVFLYKIRKAIESTRSPSAKGRITLEEGATIRVFVKRPFSSEGLEELRMFGLETTALIDPGASITVINPQLARTCGLQMHGQTRIAGVGYTEDCAIYAADISFPGTSLKALCPVRVVAAPIVAAHVSCLLGRDVLRNWKVTLDGRTGEIEIEQ
jgi:hypothetical protein